MGFKLEVPSARRLFPIHSQSLFFPTVPRLKSVQLPPIDQIHTQTKPYLSTLVEAASGEQLETKKHEAGSWIN